MANEKKYKWSIIDLLEPHLPFEFVKTDTANLSIGEGSEHKLSIDGTDELLGEPKKYLQRVFGLEADGGLLRMIWMPKRIKEEIADRLKAAAEELGVPDFPDKIADETIGITEEEILPWLEEKGHPALTMDPIM